MFVILFKFNVNLYVTLEFILQSLDTIVPLQTIY